jgi:hypothetical protein
VLMIEVRGATDPGRREEWRRRCEAVMSTQRKNFSCLLEFFCYICGAQRERGASHIHGEINKKAAYIIITIRQHQQQVECCKRAKARRKLVVGSPGEE